MKKLPIGIQSFEKIIKGNYVYVDKTAYAEKLIQDGGCYFLARPRRFGKSLFLSTLRAIFNGRKELFEECAIAKGDYKWEKYPIIYLDFTQIAARNALELEGSLKRTLINIAKSYDLEITVPTLQEGLADLVKQLAKMNPVVVLVDEYDKPMVDNLKHPMIAEENKDLLRDFFSAFKGLDDDLKFVFVTGVSKFSQVSLFSGLNNLIDITVYPNYATMLGYTEDEICRFFKDRLDLNRLAEMRNWYNGYHFAWDAGSVYNPYSTLMFSETGRTQSYWFRTGTPTFLIDQIKRFPRVAMRFSGCKATENELLNMRELNEMDVKTFMWQTGYLTFKRYDESTRLYELDFPNYEVRQAFFDALLQEFAKVSPSDINEQAVPCQKALSDKNLPEFFNRMRVCYSKIPFNLFNAADEAFFHAIFLSLLEGMGIKARAEERTNTGQIDLVVELADLIYIFEFKLDKQANQALIQIMNKNYHQKFLHRDKPIVAVGLSFSKQTRNISDWSSVAYSQKGHKVQSLQPK